MDPAKPRSRRAAMTCRFALFAIALGCGGRPPLPAGAGGSGGGEGGRPGDSGAAPIAPTPDLDLLLVIDNSSGMSELQSVFFASIARLTDALFASPSGAPNLHLAVISSDMGAGAGMITACMEDGDAGAFQTQPRSPCVDSTLDGATFLVHEEGGTNYRGPLADVVGCIGKIGTAGCNFEQHLAAISRALGADGSPPPADNAGFLRREADLAIVVLADEDDCSTSGGAASPLFETIGRRLAAPRGPVSSFRCAEFGHLCGNPPAPPPRLSPTGSTNDEVPLQGCVANPESPYLESVDAFAKQLKALKPSPDTQISVAVIAGPKAPYTVIWEQATLPDTGPWPALASSCLLLSGGQLLSAHPAIRLRDWASRFGAHGLAFDPCADDYGPHLEAIGRKIIEQLER